MITERPNVKIVCPKCFNLMIRYEEKILIFSHYKGFKCQNKKCNHVISRSELYENWDLDYRESWHIDITEKPYRNYDFNLLYPHLIKGKTLEEITDNPYIFTKKPLEETKEILKGLEKITSNKKRRKKRKFYIKGDKIFRGK